MQKWWRPVGLVVAAMLGLVVVCLGIVGPCWSAWLLDGIVVASCPDGDVRPTATVSARGVGRGSKGRIDVDATGFFVEGNAAVAQQTDIRRFSVDFTITDPTGKATPLKISDDDWRGYTLSSEVTLPAGPDGDWKLRALVDTPAGDVPVDLVVPLYAPAIAHVMTDAPLYKPGQTLRFRAVLLHEADLTPLAGRPGVWTVTDPEGTVLLEEKATTSTYGVAASTLPLVSDAPAGFYSVSFRSGAATHAQQVEVKTFQLPRFTVEAASEQAWWQPGGVPVVTGRVRYSSGAPVASASVVVTTRASGEWPPPPEWLEERTLRTDAAGGFRVPFGVVPTDLQGQASLTLHFAATDPTGDTNYGATSVLLTRDRIAVDAVTELADGLVPAASNRVFVRVTTPDGQPLRGAALTVSREGDPRDPGVPATTDADGVARFQIDPLQPVTVVVPAMPVRQQPRAALQRVTAGSGQDLINDTSLDVDAATTVERWGPASQSCLLLGEPGRATNVSVIARLDGSGRVTHAHAWTDDQNAELAACVERQVRAVAARPGVDRVWRAEVSVPDADVAWVTVDLQVEDGEATGLDAVLKGRARQARACVAGVRQREELASLWFVHTETGATRVGAERTSTASYSSLGSAEGCIAAAFAGLTLPAPAAAPAAGLLRLKVDVPASAQVAAPQPTTYQGYSLKVAATVGGTPTGDTLLRMRPGAIPNLRLRFSEVLVDPGATVELTAFRGPDFSGEVPEKLTLFQGDTKVLEFTLKERKGSFTLPKDARGYYRVNTMGAQATLYVRDPRRLEVALTADHDAWRPGEEVTLTVATRGANGPVPAGITLSGVDNAFAAIATLPKPDTFADVTVLATSDLPAFGVLDARALQTGQIRGENAAQAAVLRVSNLPARPPGTDRVDATGAAVFDVNAEITDTFYALYSEARKGVRAWEKKAPTDELLTARRMSDIWEAALAANPAEDPFGRRMYLSVLPPDLVNLTDPRFMVSDGARLPEDVENWSAYVATEAK